MKDSMNQKMRRSYQQCANGVLDTDDDPNIQFDENGVSHYYPRYKELAAKKLMTGKEGEERLEREFSRLKAEGKGKPFDCVMGVSGGVDSTYLAWLAVQHGLRPLAVHLDNGWNSETAVANISNLVSKLGIELYTHVIDWEEFKDLQLAYLKASVIDIEVLTDHAIGAIMFRMARKHGTHWVLSGMNVVTEGVMPRHWIFNKRDHVNIKAIHRQYGTVRLKTFPIFGSWAKRYQRIIKMDAVEPLNWIPYVKSHVKELIQRELGWKDYGGKHYESVWTRFYQGHILPKKFGVDKRKAHLTNLIYSGQITKEEALTELEQPIYPLDLEKQDLEFVLKKFGLGREEWDALMALPERPHVDFGIERSIYEEIPVLGAIRRLFGGSYP